MKKEYFENFEVKSGSLKDHDIGEMLNFEDDILRLNGKDICTINKNSFHVKFVSEEARNEFRQEVLSSGFVDAIKERFGQDTITENIVAIAATEERNDLSSLTAYYESKQEKKRTIGSMLSNFLKSEDDKRYEKLVEHRNGLKDSEVENSVELRDLQDEIKSSLENDKKESKNRNRNTLK